MNRLPSLFVSHGAPTFAIEPGLAGPRLTALGRALPRPRAVLVVSPHWMTPSPRVGLVSKPQTIHDFGGFDPALYEIAYPVDGHPELAQRALELLGDAGWAPQPDERRGLDHGAWVPLRHMYPAADVPAFQVSLPSRLDGDGAWAFGEALAPLAEAGVLDRGLRKPDPQPGRIPIGLEQPTGLRRGVRGLGARRSCSEATAPVCARRCPWHPTPIVRIRPPSTSGRCWWQQARRLRPCRHR